MKNKRKNEEGAVLLLLIIMMSAVVLIVASLLKFNSQNIRFAAIEVEQEQALYLAEGVGDALDYYLVNYFFSDEAIEDSEVSTAVRNFSDSSEDDYLSGVSNLLFPTTETIAGESSITAGFITVTNHSGASNFYPDATTHKLEVDIAISSSSVNRTITVTYLFPTTMPEDGYESFIFSKTLNYSN
jgi:hypothetical protein